MNSTAYQDGFDKRVPADWEPIDSVWIAWPHNRQTWPGSENGVPRFASIEPLFASIIRRIAKIKPVNLIVDASLRPNVDSMLPDQDGVTLAQIPTNDAWVRDFAPTFIASRTSGTLHAVDWRYNAWGGKYGDSDLDDAAAKAICQTHGIPSIRSDLCLEGGALEFDGDRRLITTPGCLLTPSRNPGWTEDQICKEIFQQTGATEIAWIDGGGLEGDDTDGHIDQLARFVDQKNMVVAISQKEDSNHERLAANWNQLDLWASSTHPQVTLHELPIPPARYLDGKRVPESYCNFLRLGPDHLFVPVFDAPTDDHAVELLGQLTGATIHPILCRDLAWGLGTLHCATREVPQLHAS